MVKTFPFFKLQKHYYYLQKILHCVQIKGSYRPMSTESKLSKIALLGVS